MMCGGTGAVNSATEDIQQMIDDLRMQIHEKAGQEYSQLKAISYKSQVVAGTNFFVKVHVGNDEYIHVRVFRPLPHTGQGPEIHSVLLGKTAEEEPNHF